jgi:hypothetical protein
MSNTHYHFISSLRRGLAAAITNPPGPSQQRTQIGILLHVDRHDKDSGNWDSTARPIEQTVQLYGPGDIVGFDDRMIVRTDPKPDTGNFEPNYFPLIEFADPDFVWRFTPQSALDRGLGPWIVLIVLIAEDRGEDIRREYEQIPRGSNQVSVIKVFGKQQSLPNLDHAWRWAHVQATNDQEATDAQQMEDLIRFHREQVISRLMCPRRLQPQTLYTAFVVPAFKLGWAAGLGTPAALEEAKDCLATDPAWTLDQDGPIELPYYYRWDFRTSVRGDFEYLVRLLKPRVLTGLGLREIDCERPGFGLTVSRQDHEEDDPKRHRLDMEGALQSLNTQYTRWGKDKNGPLDADPPPEIPEPEPFQQQLADDLLSRANADQALVKVPDGYYRVIESFATKLLDDGKSVRFTWTTEDETTGRIEYGAVNADGSFSYTKECESDHPAITHQITVGFAPETTYKFRLVITSQGQDTECISDATVRVPLPALVPPIYGRWHAARKNVVADRDHNGWLDVLNLDPRHRAAAGLGSEVVRKQQEALMASAWEQIGAIEAANDVLRRAQMGRECSIYIHERLNAMALEDLLRITSPVQKRITREDDSGGPRTISAELDAQTRIPAAALDPALRRIARAHGPIQKRQGARRMDMLRRLASGEISGAGKHPEPEGTLSLCDITKSMYQQFLYESKKDSPAPDTIPVPEDAKRFCDDQITCEQLQAAASEAEGTEGMDGIEDLIPHICGVFANFPMRPETVEEKPLQEAGYINDLRDAVHSALDPRSTIKERTKQRLRLSGDLAQRFEEDAPGDPLDEIMAYPEFPQPMYESLRDNSQAHILPGVETVPQNTLGLLETNGRFVESYMVGLNHELAAELLWRCYPTDQRGSYFRQFWDVSEYVPKGNADSDTPQVTDEGELTSGLREALKDIRPLHEWGNSPLGENDNRASREGYDMGESLVLVMRGDLLKRYPSTVIYSVGARPEEKDGELTGMLVPLLPEFGESSSDEEPTYPIFRGSLGADLIFLGFPFSEEDAKSSKDEAGEYMNTGKFFVLEERVAETRFGLDSADTPESPQEGWNNLDWGHFQLVEGEYLDESDTCVQGPDSEVWDGDTSAALRARITLQKPARLIIHADQMIPKSTI